MWRAASVPGLRLACVLLVVFGLLLETQVREGGMAICENGEPEWALAADSNEAPVLAVHGDTVRVVRPARALGRAVDPRSPRLRARPGGGDPFRRFREAAADEPAPARLFGGLVGVIELRV